MLPLLVPAWLPGTAGKEMLSTPTKMQNVSAVSAQLSSTHFRVISVKILPLLGTNLVTSTLWAQKGEEKKNGQLLLEPSGGGDPH